METVVVVLMILVCFNFMMKQTFRKRGSVAAIAVVATLFVGLMWPYAIQQSKTQIADWLANVQLMLDTSVVLTVEVAHCFFVIFCRKRNYGWSYCSSLMH